MACGDLPDELPDDVWECILTVVRETTPWHVHGTARRVSRLFDRVLRHDTPPPRAELRYHLPKLCHHATLSLQRTHAWPAPSVLHDAVRHRCSFCGESYVGKCSVFDGATASDDLVVYGHARCVRERCIAAYWVQTPDAKPHLLRELHPTLQEVCLRDRERLRSLPRMSCRGYHRFRGGEYRYDLVFLMPVPGKVPSRAAVLPEPSLGIGRDAVCDM